MGNFGREVTARRTAAGLSLRTLARMAYLDPGHLSRVEAGSRQPSIALAGALDRALNAHGALTELARYSQGARLEAGAAQSRRLSALFDQSADDATATLSEQAGALALAYLHQPVAVMHGEALRVRAVAVTLLRRQSRPTPDLVAVVARTSGVLAYAALDLGNPGAAMSHADLTLRCGQRMGDPALQAWARGTQSLIARFAGDYSTALAYAHAGLSAAGSGSGAVRLLCGVAQCSANLGDRDGARAALAAADRMRVAVRRDDPGVFGFSLAKQLYYSASSLVWLSEPGDAREAIRAARSAVEVWASGPQAERSLDDEALAHVYAATAAAQLADVDQADDWLEPILGLPEDRRISWIRKRMVRVADLLSTRRLRGSRQAARTVERISAYV